MGAVLDLLPDERVLFHAGHSLPSQAGPSPCEEVDKIRPAGEPHGTYHGRQYAGSVATREELKAEVERIGRDHGHTLGTWLDLGHASQLGCLGCDRYAFVQVLPPPGRAFTEAFEEPCPDPGQRLIETPE
jgi:hypothetical protein